MKQFVLNIILIIVSVCTYGQTYITVYTKFGNPIEAMIRTEMTNTEKEDALEWVSTNFPNATILSEPTALYNCHSYAWNMQDGGPTCWINGNANLSVYWSSREYYSTTTASNAVKIHYYNGDHSAITSPTVSGKYLSKWGSLPLMLHDPDYCPYSPGKNYYSKRTFFNNILECSISSRGVYVGEIANYYITNNIITPYGYTLDYIWSIVDNKEGENVIGTVATVTENGDKANISFNKSGLYTITCDVYTSMGEYISSYWIEGVVE